MPTIHLQICTKLFPESWMIRARVGGPRCRLNPLQSTSCLRPSFGRHGGFPDTYKLEYVQIEHNILICWSSSQQPHQPPTLARPYPQNNRPQLFTVESASYMLTNTAKPIRSSPFLSRSTKSFGCGDNNYLNELADEFGHSGDPLS
jgi:hypothetical protein